MPMNRAERRRLKRQSEKEAVINVKSSDIQRIKQDSTQEAVDKAFFLMLAIPVMVIHDKYPQLMKKDGREQRFADLCIDLYDSFNKGYVTLDELADCLWEEVGIKLEGVK